MILKLFVGIYFLLSVNICGQLQAWSQVPESEVNYGIIRYIKGDVFILLKGEKNKTAAKKMDKFFDGCEIITAENAFAILKLPDGSTLKLDPDTNLKVEGLIQKKGEEYKGSSYFVLTVGGVMVDVVKKFTGPPSLEIETVNQVSFGVRGTTFYIFHDKETSDVWGTVRQGQVTAMDYGKDDSEAIDAGMSMAVVEGQVLTKPHKYRWAEKLRWSFTEKDEELDTKRTNSTEDRFKELQSLYKKLRVRTKKEFVKEKKVQQKSMGNGYRTSTGEYESHDAGLFSTSNGGAGFSLSGADFSDVNNGAGNSVSAPFPAGNTTLAAPAMPAGTPYSNSGITIVPPLTDEAATMVTETGSGADSVPSPSSGPSTDSNPGSGGEPFTPEGQEKVIGGDPVLACQELNINSTPYTTCPPDKPYGFGEITDSEGHTWQCCMFIDMDGNAK